MSLKILLADDSMTAQNMGRKILTDAGYEVVPVSNGAAAIKKIAETKPQIIILDIYMPGYTGLEVCERIKGKPETANIPVLLTVGKMEPYRPEEGAKAKADGVIVKPFEATELLAAVKRIAEKLGISVPASGGSADFEKTVLLQKPPLQEFKDETYVQWKSATNEEPAQAPAANVPADETVAPAAPAPLYEEASEQATPFTMNVMPQGTEPSEQASVPEPAPTAISEFTGYSSEIDPSLLESQSIPVPSESVPAFGLLDTLTAPPQPETHAEPPTSEGLDLGAMMMDSLMEMPPLVTAEEQPSDETMPEASVELAPVAQMEPVSPEPQVEFAVAAEASPEMIVMPDPGLMSPEGKSIEPSSFSPAGNGGIADFMIGSGQEPAPEPSIDIVDELFASLSEDNAMVPVADQLPPELLVAEPQAEPEPLSVPEPEAVAAPEVVPPAPPVEQSAPITEREPEPAPPEPMRIGLEAEPVDQPLTLEELDAMLGLDLPPLDEPIPEGEPQAMTLDGEIAAESLTPEVSEVLPEPLPEPTYSAPVEPVVAPEPEAPVEPLVEAAPELAAALPSLAVEAPIAAAPEPVAPVLEPPLPEVAPPESVPEISPEVIPPPKVERQEDHEFAAAMAAALDSLGVESLPATAVAEHVDAVEVSALQPESEPDHAHIADVVQRVFDRYKSQMIADIARELTQNHEK